MNMVGTNAPQESRLNIKVIAGADTWAGRNLMHIDLFQRLGGHVQELKKGVPLTAVGGHSIDQLGVAEIEVNGIKIEVYVLEHMGVLTQLLLGDPALRQMARDNSRGQLRVDYSRIAHHLLCLSYCRQ